MRESNKKNFADQRGISLILSVVVVTALMGIVITVANITLRVTKDSSLITASEVAFLSAESAAEITLYDVIKNGGGISLPDLVNQPQGGAINALWGRTVTAANTIPARCNVSEPKSVCTTSTGPVTSSNALQLKLQAGESFQFDFDIAGVSYPTGVGLAGNALPQSNMIVVSNGVQNKIPTTGGSVSVSNLGSANGTRMRLKNNSTVEATYLVTPEGTGELPLGINISTTGTFLGVERRLEITRPAWLIY